MDTVRPAEDASLGWLQRAKLDLLRAAGRSIPKSVLLRHPREDEEDDEQEAAAKRAAVRNAYAGLLRRGLIVERDGRVELAPHVELPHPLAEPVQIAPDSPFAKHLRRLFGERLLEPER